MSDKEARYYKKLFEKCSSELMNAEFEIISLRRNLSRFTQALSLLSELNINIQARRCLHQP